MEKNSKSRPTRRKKAEKTHVPSLGAVADVLGFSRRNFSRWRAKGLTLPEPDERGHDLEAWRKFIEANDLRRAQRLSEDPEIQRLRLEQAKLKNRLRELDIAVREGRRAELADVAAVICARFSDLQMDLRQAKHRLAPDVVGLSVGEANHRIGKDFEECLRGVRIAPPAGKSRRFFTALGERVRKQVEEGGR
jgi:hypothetical protein